MKVREANYRNMLKKLIVIKIHGKIVLILKISHRQNKSFHYTYFDTVINVITDA